MKLVGEVTRLDDTLSAWVELLLIRVAIPFANNLACVVGVFPNHALDGRLHRREHVAEDKRIFA